jgi:cellulose synthase/poly-beta-1,6-N-acetylglucosamine synthase-like glycosyltransferase
MLFVAVTAILVPRRHPRPSPAPATSRFAFVIPAHDEEAGIRSTIASCQAVDYDPDRFSVYVIADNCSDATADVARRAGASVIERHDPSRRGKGQALDFFFNQAPGSRWADSHDAAVVVDADSVVDRSILTAFAAALAEGKEWIQSYNMPSNSDASRRTRMLTYAFSLINGVWLVGQEGLGLSTSFRGNGMCFATSALGRIPWSGRGLAEDLEFSWVLRTAGERIYFQPDACVRSEMLTRWGPVAASQRRRWEWGRREVCRQFAGPLLRSRKLGPFRKVAYLIDLFYPPISTLLLVLVAAMSIHIGALFEASLLPASLWLLPVHGFMVLALAIYGVSPVIVMGTPARLLLSILDLPYYVAWKALVTWNNKPTGWMRTEREPNGAARIRRAEDQDRDCVEPVC